MKIVVRTPNWIGDSILAQPTLFSLSKNFQQSEIWIAAKDWTKDLFISHEFIKGVISLPEGTDIKSLRLAAQKIREYRFDVGLLLTNSFSSALLFYMAKIPERWGYRKDGREILLTKGASLKNKEDHSHQVNFYLELLLGLGLKTFPPMISFPLREEEKSKAKEFLLLQNVNLKHPLVFLNPGAAYGPAKRWPPEKFANLAAMFQKEKRAKIMIVGSPSEIPLAESIASLMTEKPLNLAGQTTLRMLAGLLSYADLFVANDSGPMHLANALRIPVVALFGPTDPHITGPFQDPSIVIKKDVPCWPCSYRECPFDHRCMMNIEPEEVFQISLKFLR